MAGVVSAVLRYLQQSHKYRYNDIHPAYQGMSQGMCVAASSTLACIGEANSNRCNKILIFPLHAFNGNGL